MHDEPIQHHGVRRAIMADRLVDGTGAAALDHPVLVIRGDRIEEISSRSSWDDEAAMDRIDRYEGATILPGLIDGHVHLALSAGASSEEVLAEYMDSDAMRLAAMATENARRCLVGGVTTVRDCGGPDTMIQSLRNAIQAGVTRGPRVLATGMPITTTAGHCHFFGLRADDAHEVRKAVRQLVQDDVDWIKVMATGGRMTRNSNILRAQYSTEELRAIVDEARRLERRVAAHVLSTEGIRNSVAAGVDTLEHCNWQDEHGAWSFDEDLLASMQAQGTHVSITIVGYMRDAYAAWRQDPKGSPLSDLLAHRFAMEGEMFARGLNAFITSDAGVPGSHFAELYRSVAVAVAWHGLDPLTAIAAVTSRAADALGIAREVGTLERGKRADLIVVDGDPASDIDDLGLPRVVYQGGKVVCVDGAVRPPDIRDLGPRPASTVRTRRVYGR